jgi:hypothetical protein
MGGAGVALDSLLAAGGSAAPSTGRTRPICVYPQTVIYNGHGSTDDAANFHCGGNVETHAAVCADVLPFRPPIAGAGTAGSALPREADDIVELYPLPRRGGLEIRADSRKLRLVVRALHNDATRTITTTPFRLIQRLVGEADGPI